MKKLKIRWQDGAMRGSNAVGTATVDVDSVRVEDSVAIFMAAQGVPVLAVPVSRFIDAVEVTE